MQFTALGDSITYGEGATSVSHTYPNVLAHLLQDSRSRCPALGHILAAPGWTSGALKSAVIENGPLPLLQSQAVIVWIGGDDIANAGLRAIGNAKRAPALLKQSITNYAIQLGLLLTYIKKVHRDKVTLVCTQYNPFPNSAIAVRAIASLNQATMEVANRVNVQVVPSASWFAGREPELIRGYTTGRIESALRGPLAIHPNNRGHRVIAEGLLPYVAPNGPR